jgi:DNA helicase IV
VTRIRSLANEPTPTCCPSISTVSVVKGLELDGVIVVEPSAIVDSIEHGMRALYVALTRSTQRLTVVHVDELPAPLR